MKKRLVQISCAVLILSILAVICIIPAMSKTEQTTVTLADSSTSWQYLDNNTDPAANLGSLNAWTLSDFDDSEWKSASGSFGSKNGSLAAVNGYTPTVLLPLKGASDTNNYMTYFFRTKIDVNDVDNISALLLSVNADDAVVVYINGTVILDTRSVKNDTTNLYYSGTSVYSSSFWLDPNEIRGLLVEGENVIAASVHNSNSGSSDIYFDLAMSATYSNGVFVTTFENVIMSVGSNETERTLNWYTTSSEAGEVQWAKKSDMSQGAFPTEYSKAIATSSKASNAPGDYTNKATLTSLEENTEYVYRLKNGSKYSSLYYFTVGSFGDYDFVVFGDPQIRSYSFSYTVTDIDKWNDTLDKAGTYFPDAEFYVSMGDQVNVKNDESEYDAFISSHLSSNAIATTIGNHDSGSYAYSEHFNLPNLSTKYGVKTPGADYWYTYGNTLFMNLNYWGDSIANHAAFMEEAIEANPDCVWQVAMLHISPFSAGSHANDSDVTAVREELTPYMNELGIDLVLGGHDHIYTRSYLMDGSEIAANQSNIDAEGVLYLCTGATGGKFYTEDKVNSGEGYEYVAFTYYEQSRVVLHFDVTDNSLTLNTYLVDDMSLLDSYTLAKSAASSLKEAIYDAKSALTAAEGNLPDSYLAALQSAVTDGEAILADFDNSSAEQIIAVIELLENETLKLNSELESYNTVSAGAKETGADTASNMTVLHLEDSGSYSLSGGGSGAAIKLVKNNTDGSSETVLTWTEGSSTNASKNPYVAFILDGDVTFSGCFNWFFSNIVVDLNGNDLTFNSGSSIPIILSNGASLEVRGDGNLIWGSGTSNNYLVQGSHYYSSLILNGNITLIDKSSSGRYPFYLKGKGYVHGTLTIDATFDSSTGYVFYIQGSRSSAEDRSGSITLDGATVNYNSTVGSPLFYAKGISGEYNGITYTSIPKVNILNSRVNLKSPLATSKWGQDSVSGYGSSKSEALTNCINMTELNIENSYIYSDFYYTSSSAAANLTTLNPSGYTTVNIKNSTLHNKYGTIFRTTSSGKLTIVAENSTFIANTTQSQATDLGNTQLQGNILITPVGTLGIATFESCTLKSQYRIIEGHSNDVSTSTYLVKCTDCQLVVDTASNLGGGHAVVRANAIIDGGSIDCGSGGLCYKIFPYNATTGKGLLIKGPVVINNFASASLSESGNEYAKTVNEFAEEAKNDSTVYTTQLSSNHFTIENGCAFVAVTAEGTLSSRYAFRLTRPTTDNFTILSSITLYTDFAYNLYVPVRSNLTSVTVGTQVYSDLSSLEITEVKGASYYKISTRVAVSKAADTITVKVTLAEADGTTLTGKWDISVVKYLNNLLNVTESDTEKALAKDILSYVRASYAYVDSTAEAISVIDTIIGENYDSSSIPNTDIDGAFSVAGLSSATLELGNAPAFRFYVDGSYDASLYKFSAGGKAVETEIITEQSGKTCIRISMYAYAMTDTVTYTIDGTDISGEYNLKTYYDFTLTANSPLLVSLVERLWRYSESAKAYKAEIAA